MTTKKLKNKGGAPGGNQNAVGNDGGRPTKWNCEDHAEDTLAKTNLYLCDFLDKKKGLPTIEGLAVYLNVAVSTVYEWKNQGKEEGADLKKVKFSEVLDVVLALQADVLIQKGLRGEWNATIVKLLLCSDHGKREKSENTNVHDVTERASSFLRRVWGE